MPHQGSQCRADSERPVLTLHESLALADAIDPRYRALVLLAVFGSLRWGELMGLTRLDLDLVGATVHVRRSVAEVASKLVIKEPKSQAGVRSVALPQWLIPELLTHLEEYAEPGPAGRVFVGAKGSTPRRGHWTKIWRAARPKPASTKWCTSTTSRTRATTWRLHRARAPANSWGGWATAACGLH